MEQRITERLTDLERDEDIRIIYACESGSRAWGFPSRDSDYDVRFIYLRPVDWYLSVDACIRRDVIEPPIDDMLDINGWDLPKALRLLCRSNPPLLEWLGSPIVYHEIADITRRIRALTEIYYSPRACAHHYLHMAEGNSRSYLQGETVQLKKYFYVLRPLLAIRWIEAGRGVVPVPFDLLVETMVESAPLRDAIEELRRKKLTDHELRSGPRVPAISDFIDAELERHRTELARFERVERDAAELNELFRSALRELWP